MCTKTIYTALKLMIIIFIGPQGIPKSASYISINRNQSSGDLGSMSDVQHNLSFMRKIPQGAEASNILVGEIDFIEKTISAFIRLETAVILGDLTEVPVPTRFLFILLTPSTSTSGTYAKQIKHNLNLEI